MAQYIKPTELRIGNWVYYKGDPKARLLFTIQEDDDDFFEPIPLTNEWIEKFEFEPINKNILIKEWKGVLIKRWEGGWTAKFTISFEHGSWCYMVYDSHNDVYWHHGQDFLYVHQLQNLYFALTGQELTVKQPA